MRFNNMTQGVLIFRTSIKMNWLHLVKCLCIQKKDEPLPIDLHFSKKLLSQGKPGLRNVRRKDSKAPLQSGDIRELHSCNTLNLSPLERNLLTRQLVGHGVRLCSRNMIPKFHLRRQLSWQRCLRRNCQENFRQKKTYNYISSSVQKTQNIRFMTNSTLKSIRSKRHEYQTLM